MHSPCFEGEGSEAWVRVVWGVGGYRSRGLAVEVGCVRFSGGLCSEVFWGFFGHRL